MNVAIIPARGGSQRIPRKNIRCFAGRPIISYSISAAKDCGLFDRIIVSTDDKEIAEIAIGAGAEVPFLRPKALADEYTGTGQVIKHALGWLIDNGENIEFACCIYATAPFIQTGYLKEGFERLSNSDRMYAFSVTSFPFPIQRSIRITDQGYVEAIWAENISKRSQDLEEAYHDAGQFYWGRSDAFLNDEVIFSHASIPIVIPRYLVQDIDTPEDWKRAELMYVSLTS